MKTHIAVLPLDQYLEVTRSRLLGRFPFFGILVMSLPLVPDERVETAATNGSRIYYNPQWFEQLRAQHDDHVMFVLAHECMHPALGHLWRRGDRDAAKWNVSADLLTNELLKDSGLQGPPEGLYLGNTVGGVYFDPAWKQLSEEEICQRLPDPPRQYLLCGDILAPADGGQQQAGGGASLADIWRDRLVQAAHVARQQGKLPAGIARLVEQLLHPSKDWRQVLAEFVQPTAWDYDWRRLDRRLLPDELYIPTLSGERIDDLVVAVDSSGSIGIHEQRVFFSELHGILSAYPQVRATVMSCDAKVHQVWELDQDAPIPTAVLGGGGTSFVPVFEKIAELGLQPSAVVFLTDGYGDYPDREPSYPVLWVLTPDHRTPPWGRTTVLDDIRPRA